MPEVRSVASGSTPEQVIAGEVARLTAELADLRSTVLARTSMATSIPLRNGTAPAVNLGSGGFLYTDGTGRLLWRGGSGTVTVVAPA